MKNLSKEDKKIVGGIILFLIGYLIFFWSFIGLWDATAVAGFIIKFGLFADFIFIFLAVLKYIFAVIPSPVFIMTGSVLFGPLKSFIYMMIAVTVGTYFAIKVSQKYGQPFVEKWLGKRRFKKVNNLSGDKTLMTFFMVHVTPGTPSDLLPFAAGLTKIPTWKLMTIFIIGRAPYFYMYSRVGSSLKSMNFKLMIETWIGFFIFVGALYMFKKILATRGIKIGSDEN